MTDMRAAHGRQQLQGSFAGLRSVLCVYMLRRSITG